MTRTPKEVRDWSEECDRGRSGPLRSGVPRHLMRMPEMARAITRRWISEVPSKIV
ncbi:hypothetical protein HDA44_001865 [Kribbella solani]|uniref:Uncharacterized protein n=1 Tax=Kribbella solani TaxID=236067 RepID=A0A841DHA4_9ACTN|nr:hypothetical protein [Kribbella solani]